MNYYIAPTTVRPLFFELQILRFKFNFTFEDRNCDGFGLYDEEDCLIKNFTSYNEAVNYCQEYELRLVK